MPTTICKKTYSQYITRFDDHLNKVNLALTNSGKHKETPHSHQEHS